MSSGQGGGNEEGTGGYCDPDASHKFLGISHLAHSVASMLLHRSPPTARTSGGGRGVLTEEPPFRQNGRWWSERMVGLREEWEKLPSLDSITGLV